MATPARIARAQRLYAILASLLRAKPKAILRQITDRNGLEVWRVLTNTYAPKTKFRGLALLNALMALPTFTKDRSLREQIHGLERVAHEYQRVTGRQPGEDVLLGTLVRCLPSAIKQHVQLQMSESSTYQSVRDYVLGYEITTTSWSSAKMHQALGVLPATSSSDPQGATPMDIDALQRKGPKGGKGGKSGKNDKAAKGKPGKGDKGGKWGKSGKAAEGKPSKGDKGGKGGKSGKPKAADKRDIQCYLCGKKGHYQSECWHNPKGRKGVQQVQGSDAASTVAPSTVGPSVSQAAAPSNARNVNRVELGPVEIDMTGEDVQVHVADSPYAVRAAHGSSRKLTEVPGASRKFTEVKDVITSFSFEYELARRFEAMPAFHLSRLVGHRDWVSSAEQRLFALLKTGHPSPVSFSASPMCTSRKQEVKAKPIATAKVAVAVVAPGAGTGINGAVYSEIACSPSFKVDVIGRSRAPYDVYPPCWPQGAPAPNLQSFAEEVVETGAHRNAQVMIFGSRGGQVVLPQMWQAEAQGLVPPVPPAVVINGGCAMNLPTPVYWPDSAVNFLLIGGNDNFRGNLSMEEYVAETRSYVPPSNKTTAILSVNEMTHMPQQSLLRGILRLMLKALVSWKAEGKVPLERLRQMLAFLRQDGWSGRLLYTMAPGAWEDIPFSPRDREKLQVAVPRHIHQEDLGAGDEAKALWKAAMPYKGHRLAQAVKVC
ncbi:hypothetical protein AK812_SmicGene14196 [Symbiodinium microadriaticum]|uniref:CCHC-type domain-containing protein n=1 Tax=Symbiodinium microadriaticum TaxID=2951 RepID=A0A1Q9E697_SYMMI|nr:hypothetical protein AK812_SmicGene14196 [Symbiodinium microadriaticum]